MTARDSRQGAKAQRSDLKKVKTNSSHVQGSRRHTFYLYSFPYLLFPSFSFASLRETFFTLRVFRVSVVIFLLFEYRNE